MNDSDFMRYSRQLLLEDIAIEGQQKLLASRVLIVGLGGLGSPAALYLAGAGKAGLRGKAEALAQSLGLQEQVRFLGNVPDLPQRLAATQVFVLSSHWEGMPLALVEAMAAGCACVGSDVLGVREVLEHGRTGLLVPPAEATALAYALQQLLQNPAQAQRLGQAARQQALTACGREHMWRRYRALLNAPGGRD